ncbi:MAG TPA: protein kinase, partial [Kofleriaceae bacterium]|nr:protein kinase [Kofleriaceae bacterium]
GARVVKVLDFGIAKLSALDDETARSTGITTGVVLGTPAYMAPEQVFGERDVDHRADIWALGILFYQCLSGVLPTIGDNIGQVLKHVLARPFEPLDLLVPDLPADVARLVARMLARERADRPADLREVLAVLEPRTAAPGVGFGPPAAALAGVAAAASTSPIALDDTVPSGPRHGPAPAGAAAPRGRRARRRALVGSAALVVLLGAGVAGWQAWQRGRSSAPGSPLAAPRAKLACPVLRASGVEEPAGWLGAAAAVIACERGRVILGGLTDRTLVPAELLDLPPGPSETFPPDPYVAPDARDRTRAAARLRAAAYLDGDVTWTHAGFTVALSLHRPDGATIASAAGDGPALYEAVRSAMAPLVGPDRIPRARALEPEVAAWSRTADIDDALAALDLAFAVAHNAGDLASECDRFEALSARVGELGAEGRYQCAYVLGRPPPDIALPPAGASDAGRAMAIRIHHAVHQTYRPEDLAFLRQAFQREHTPRGQSLLAAIESCLLGSLDPQAARERAIVAVQSEPKNPEGGSCNPWEQLTTLERDTVGGAAAMRAMRAWEPWNSYAWLAPGFQARGTDPAGPRLLRRAHLLSPLDTYLADAFVTVLLASGDREEARGVAAELRRGGLAIHDVESELILVRVETSEARFAAALARAQKASEIASADTAWLRAQRFELGWHALELSALLGQGHEVADQLVARFLAPDPPLLDANLTSVPLRVPAICARSSAPARCFARFRAIRQALPGAITADTDEFLAGAERYAAGDLPGAARAWRPLLAGGMALDSTLPDAMVDAFERTGAADLAERVDREVMMRAGELHGATPGHVRAARRALARGDRVAARQLAELVVNAWSVADEPPPAVAEMRRLVARLTRT